MATMINEDDDPLMMNVFVLARDGAHPHPYYGGEAAKCPPLPRRGDEIRGTFGVGIVTHVRHTRVGGGFLVQLICTKFEGEGIRETEYD
jgi:hypothetical protein